VATLGAAALAAAPAEAQSASELQAAATAFQEGQRAQLRGDFAQAAELFDLANRTAPSAAALRSSIRMHQSAGHLARAATLADEARALYATDAATVALADEVLGVLAPSLGHLTVRCEPACALTADARIVSTDAVTTTLYLDPGAHELSASWGARTLARSVDLTAGARLEVTLALADVVEPVEAEEPAPVAPTLGDPPLAPAPTSSDSGDEAGLSPAFFGVGAGLTAASLVGAIVAGVDMLGARDRYVAMPTEAGWRDGVAREMVTNALIGTTVGLAVATVVLAIVTDWDGAPQPSTAPRLALSPHAGGALADLTLSF
jgi:hypothetical protein